jgi:aryl-alcohol dehydrogenase-like predicted oxidoreductase
MSYNKNISKLALGTVQFGLGYGVANSSGQVGSEEVAIILDTAKEQGIDTIDTAINYGDSELVLGNNCLEDFSLITKLPEVPKNYKNLEKWIDSQLDGSLERLSVPSLDAILLHQPLQLLESFGEKLFQKMELLKSKGLVKKIGISVYSPHELDSICNNFRFDIVQAPFNILDKRFLESGWMDKLQEEGTSLHVRSIFMQGLLLMKKSERPEQFSPWNKIWNRWHQWLEETNQSPLEACLRYVINVPKIEKIVIGIDSKSHLQEIINSVDDQYFEVPKDIHSNDLMLLNPSNWK